MITESESSSSPPTAEATNDAAAAQHAEPHKASGGTERSEDVATSSLNSANDTSSLGVRKTSITSPDPTAYVAKARITRPTPPPPPYNPMQFVQIKPCNLYQTAQQQLKKAEEVKKIKEIKKEEPEDWQNNLDNWKSSRRKRVEHIIDRVVEVKKLEYEEYDRSRRKSKTFSEMIEERGERGVRVGRAKLASLAVYNEDESNDLSDLGIGTSSTSGKSSLSEEYDNNSVMSDNNDLEKANGPAANHLGTSIAREYVSSPGYDTSSSTAPASSPDPCEYTYESAIQDYKQRVSRAKLGSVTSLQRQTKTTSKESTPENDDSTPLNNYSARRGSKIEERLIGFEVNSPNDNIESSEKTIVDLPKINISKRKEIFENAVSNNSSYQLPTGSSEPKRQDSSDVSKVPLREHIKVEETFTPKTKVEGRRLSGDMTSVKDRLLSLEQQQQLANSVNGDARALQSRAIDISVPPLKERLTSLQNAASKDELKKPPVVLVDARQLEIMKDEEEHARQRKKQMDVAKSLESKALQMESETEDTADEMAVESRGSEIDRDDSGIQTADDIEEEQRGHVVPQLLSRTQEEKLDEAIAALAVEERQLEQATTVINKIEAESTQLSNVTNAEDAASPNTISPTASDELPRQMEFSINEALELAPEVNDRETAAHQTARTTPSNNQTETDSMAESQHRIEEERAAATPGLEQRGQNEPIYENISTTAAGQVDTEEKFTPVHSKTSYPNLNNGFAISSESSSLESHVFLVPSTQATAADEPYYQVPKSCEPYYDAPKHLRPIPVYENIEVFYSGVESSSLTADNTTAALKMEPPKEKPPPPPTESPPAFHACDSLDNGDNWSSDNTYETIATRLSNGTAAAPGGDPHPSPPIKRLNSTKRIKKELRHKRSSFLGIEGSIDDDLENYLELTVAPPPDMAQLLQEERRLEKQLYMKAGLCDSSDTGESRDSGVSENHSRQSSEPFTNSSEEVDCGDELPLSLITDTGIKPSKVVYQREAHLRASQTPLLQTVKGNSAESWTESATVAAAATKSLTEATATANAKMQSIEEKIREQEEVLRVERELLHLEQEELKRQRENLLLRENLARRELQHGAKMLMSANRCSLQDLPAAAVPSSTGFHPAQMEPVQQRLNPQQIYANVPTPQQQHYLVDTDYRKSMSDLNELSKRLMLSTPLETTMAPTKPMRALQVPTTNGHDDFARQHPSPNPLRASAPLIKIAAVHSNQPAPPVHQSTQNCAVFGSNHPHNGHPHANMTRNTLHALSATPRPKYTDGWVQVQSRKSVDSSLSRDPAWLASYRQKRKSVPDAYHFGSSGDLTSFPENGQRRLAACSASASYPGPSTTSSNGKPLPDSVIQTLTERLQSKGIGERKRFENYAQKSAMQATAFSKHQGYHANSQQHYQPLLPSHTAQRPPIETVASNHATVPTAPAQDKVLSVSGKKRCSHCGDELGRGAAMIIESLLLFYHINCFKCCVCHVQLGDGLNGTDVRVRNHKLHCQNCYSSDDGIKFSCV